MPRPGRLGRELEPLLDRAAVSVTSAARPMARRRPVTGSAVRTARSWMWRTEPSGRSSRYSPSTGSPAQSRSRLARTSGRSSGWMAARKDAASGIDLGQRAGPRPPRRRGSRSSSAPRPSRGRRRPRGSSRRAGGSAPRCRAARPRPAPARPPPRRGRPSLGPARPPPRSRPGAGVGQTNRKPRTRPSRRSGHIDGGPDAQGRDSPPGRRSGGRGPRRRPRRLARRAAARAAPWPKSASRWRPIDASVRPSRRHSAFTTPMPSAVLEVADAHEERAHLAPQRLAGRFQRLAGALGGRAEPLLEPQQVGLPALGGLPPGDLLDRDGDAPRPGRRRRAAAPSFRRQVRRTPGCAGVVPEISTPRSSSPARHAASISSMCVGQAGQHLAHRPAQMIGRPEGRCCAARTSLIRR